MARYRHSLRQARDHLPCWHNSLRHPHLEAPIGRHALVSGPATPAQAPPGATWCSATGGHSHACSDPVAAEIVTTVITRGQSTCDGGEMRRSLGSCTQQAMYCQMLEKGCSLTMYATTATTAVQARSVNLSVGNTRILRDCSVIIPQRGLTSIVGPSGAGKTSLLYCLSGLDQPDTGQILVGQTDIYSLRSEARAKFLRENVGFIFQQYNLIPYLTVEENITLPSTMAHRKVDHGFLTHTMETFGLIEKRKTRASLLSGGEQQRVALCRSIVLSPAVIFADEPTGALDSRNSALVLQSLGDLASQGATIVMVTHDVDAAALADRVVFMHDGTVTNISSNQISPNEISSVLRGEWGNNTEQRGSAKP